VAATDLSAVVGDRRLTVSVGVTLAEADADPSEAVRRADAALYRAKDAGRDRVVVDLGDGRSRASA
jgi:PleD family two-component response regulator